MFELLDLLAGGGIEDGDQVVLTGGGDVGIIAGKSYALDLLGGIGPPKLSAVRGAPEDDAIVVLRAADDVLAVGTELGAFHRAVFPEGVGYAGPDGFESQLVIFVLLGGNASGEAN